MSSVIGKVYFAVTSLIRMVTIKAFHGKNFSCGKLPYLKGKVDIDLDNKGTLKLGNKIKMMKGDRLGVRENAMLVIGDRTSINVGTMIICHDKIEIGEDTQIGPYCQIFDHDHAYKTIEDLDSQKFISAPISIGKHVWIGANCVILRGTVIGDHCVVAAGTVLKGTYKANSLIYTKREIKTKNITDKLEEHL